MADVARSKVEQPRIRVRTPAPATVVVLDPAGRLLDMGTAPGIYLIEDGTHRTIHAWSETFEHKLKKLPAEGAELLVVAHGCKPARVPAKAGRNVVRLEAGFRVRVVVDGDRPSVPPDAQLGIRLSRRVEAYDGIPFPHHLRLQAIAADAFDVDLPTHSQYMAIPEDGAFDVLVPTPGRYQVGWVVQSGNGISTSTVGEMLLEPDMDLLDLVWGKSEIESAVKRMKER